MNQEICENILIEKDSAKYILHLSYIGEIISFKLEYDSNYYVKKIPLKEIKDNESKAVFSSFPCKEFITFLKQLSDMKKVSLIKNDKNIIIKFEAPILLKVHIIEIELLNKEQYQLDNEFKKLKQENIELKKKLEELEIKHDKEINELKKYVKTNKSVIMEDNEFEFIHEEIKKKLDKPVKELKKLYQASIDGDGIINFHSRCDCIPNILVLVKTAGNRRFGGFTSKIFNFQNNNYLHDEKAFLFSLDKKQIYPCKNTQKAINND